VVVTFRTLKKKEPVINGVFTPVSNILHNRKELTKNERKELTCPASVFVTKVFVII
jgi:hypothetical protein